MAKLFKLGVKLGIDLEDATVDAIKDICVAVLAGGSGFYWMVKRVAAGKGKDPQPPPIESPVTTVKRLTQ